MRGAPLTTTLPPEDAKYVMGLAEAMGISVSSVLAEIVRKHIAAEEARLTQPRKQK